MAMCYVFVCSILHRVVLALHETLEEDWDKTKEHLHIFGGT